jgi:hypothetical protein
MVLTTRPQVDTWRSSTARMRAPAAVNVPATPRYTPDMTYLNPPAGINRGTLTDTYGDTRISNTNFNFADINKASASKPSLSKEDIEVLKQNLNLSISINQFGSNLEVRVGLSDSSGKEFSFDVDSVDLDL